MRPDNFIDGHPGRLVSTAMSGKQGWAYVPNPLPPVLHYDQQLTAAVERAARALGNLNGSCRMLPNPSLLLRPFMSREALASSRIEGTRAEYGQLLLLEEDEESSPADPDLQEVSNYIATLHTAWNTPSERPFSSGFLMELHRQLMQGVRGSTKGPGQLRPYQVLIGSALDDLNNARFVPPPPEMVRELLDELCQFINAPSEIPSLIRLAYLHYQFEAIHPFQDGNGRLGRLILPVILGMWGDLDLPLLYLSEFFEDHRDEYVDSLLAISQRNAWRPWILFTLKAIEVQSLDAVDRGRSLLALREELRQQYSMGRSSTVAYIIDALFQRPSLSVVSVARGAGVSYRAASMAVKVLVDDGVLHEVTGRKRGRLYLAPHIVDAIIRRRSHGESDTSNRSRPIDL